MPVRVQSEDFDLGAELAGLHRGCHDIGAVVTFTGLVRGGEATDRIDAMELEHYPAMTTKALESIEAAARDRWRLQASLIIHRVGRLLPGEQIMMVATASRHRQDAFEAAEFLMDYLKSRAPFWKREFRGTTASWVNACESDEAAILRWDKT